MGPEKINDIISPYWSTQISPVYVTPFISVGDQ